MRIRSESPETPPVQSQVGEIALLIPRRSRSTMFFPTRNGSARGQHGGDASPNEQISPNLATKPCVSVRKVRKLHQFSVRWGDRVVNTRRSRPTMFFPTRNGAGARPARRRGV